jgi:small conductance mechanosensitive channel
VESLANLLAHGRAWLPFLAALLVTVAALAGARHLLIVRPQPRGLGQQPVLRQLAMLLLTGICVVGLILTLPVSESAHGQLLSLFGLVITAVIALSSTTFVGNAMAGFMLRAVRHIRAGDFIKVGEHFGRVSEQGFLHLEIQTEDRDLTTLPNLYLVSQPVTVVRSSGTIVSASVSLGYDVHRSRVDALLKDAAARADLLEPFVQILDLGDYAVTYRVAGFLPEVKHLIAARSRLRAMMLDALHAGGVEIVSPAFMNQRRVAEGRSFIPAPFAAGGASASGATPGSDEGIPESLMFDKANEAQSIDQARQQVQLVVDEIADTRKAREAAKEEAARAHLDRRLAILERQRERFEERLAAIVRAAEKDAQPK